MRLKPLDAEEIKIFVSEFGTLLEKEAGIPPDKRRVFRLDTLDPRDSLFIVAEFSGDIDGKVFIGLDETAACVTAENINKARSGDSIPFDRVSDQVKMLVLELSQHYFKGIAAALKEQAGRRCEVSAAHFREAGEARARRQYTMIPFSVNRLSQIHLSMSLQAVKKTGHTGRRRIVIVDESSSTRDFLEKVLEEANYHVVGEFTDEAEALLNLKGLAPDMVLLNIDAPGLDIMRMLAGIKVEYPRAKVVIMTGTADRATILSCIQNGATTCILKPFQPAKLVETVKKVFNMP